MANQLIMPRLTPDECQEREDKINAHAENIRLMLVELHEGEAWVVRGFATWREYVVAKFNHSESHLYRLLNAGLIERQLHSPIGENPESHLREIGKLDDVALRQATWAAVQDQPKITAQIVKRAVNAAVDWANEYIVSQGHTSLEGDSLEVAKTAITERMLENRLRQQQHIVDSIAKKWDQPVSRAAVTIKRVSESTGLVVLKCEPEVIKQFLTLLDAKGLQMTVLQPIVKKTEANSL